MSQFDASKGDSVHAWLFPPGDDSMETPPKDSSNYYEFPLTALSVSQGGYLEVRRTNDFDELLRAFAVQNDLDTEVFYGAYLHLLVTVGQVTRQPKLEDLTVVLSTS